jgi:predicted acyltransferase
MATNLNPILFKLPRLLSLDVFRGITVMAMVLVNNPGDWGHIYAPLEHAHWNGCTPTDLVFPFFLFIMGVSIVYAMQSKKADSINHSALLIKSLKRAAVIFALGLFMSTFWDWDLSTIRIPGVLQRIALVYLICSIIYIKTGYPSQVILLALILAGYYALMTLVPVPDVGVPNLQPETNLGAWLDRTLMGTAHLWKESKTWDPEGLLSTLPAIGTGLLGILTGTWLKRKDRADSTKIYLMLGAGILIAALGLLWNNWFPINKALWTSSYVLFTGGLAILSLALCYWLVDVQRYRWFTKPFVVYGVNAITVYVASGLIARSMNRIHIDYRGNNVSLSSAAMYDAFFDNTFSTYNASLAWAIAFVLAWMVVLWVMYNRRIFIKI